MMDINELINKITCADCMDILKQLPDKCIDLVLTDPPYGGGGQDAWKGKNRSRFGGWFNKYHIGEQNRGNLEQEISTRGHL